MASKVVLAGLKNDQKEVLRWQAIPLKPRFEQDDLGDGSTFSYQTIEERRFGRKHTCIRVRSPDRAEAQAEARSVGARPRLDMIIGNKTSKAPNTATLGWDFQKFIVAHPRAIASHSLTFGPEYTVDRQNENRDLGLDAHYDPLVARWEGKTIEQQRADAERDGGDALAIKWG